MASWLTETDPWLTTRMKKRTEIAAAENQILKPTAKAMDVFLKSARRNILGQPTTTTFATTTPPVPTVDLSNWPPIGEWEALVTDLILPAVTKVFDAAAKGATGLAMTGTELFRIAYLGGVQDRLRMWPAETYNYVRGFVAKGIAEGTGTRELTKQLTELLSVTGTIDGKPAFEWQARRIARTETIGAYNGGAYYAAAAQADADPNAPRFKQWLATHDTRTRHTHTVANGQVTPMTSTFDVGGSSLLYPGDPLGPAEEVIQCRCTLLILDAEEAKTAGENYRSIVTPQA